MKSVKTDFVRLVALHGYTPACVLVGQAEQHGEVLLPTGAKLYADADGVGLTVSGYAADGHDADPYDLTK